MNFKLFIKLFLSTFAMCFIIHIAHSKTSTIESQMLMDDINYQLNLVNKSSKDFYHKLDNGNIQSIVTSTPNVRNLDNFNNTKEAYSNLLNKWKESEPSFSAPACEKFHATLTNIHQEIIEMATINSETTPERGILESSACFISGARGSDSCNIFYSRSYAKAIISKIRIRILRQIHKLMRGYFLIDLDQKDIVLRDGDGDKYTYKACKPRNPSDHIKLMDELKEMSKRLSQSLFAEQGINAVSNDLRNLRYIKQSYIVRKNQTSLFRAAGFAIAFEYTIAKTALNMKKFVKGFKYLRSSINGYRVARAYLIAQFIATSARAAQTLSVYDFMNNKENFIKDMLQDKETFQHEVEAFLDNDDILAQDLDSILSLLEMEVEARKSSDVWKRKTFETINSSLNKCEMVQGLKDQLEKVSANCTDCNKPEVINIKQCL